MGRLRRVHESRRHALKEGRASLACWRSEMEAEMADDAKPTPERVDRGPSREIEIGPLVPVAKPREAPPLSSLIAVRPGQSWPEEDLP